MLVIGNHVLQGANLEGSVIHFELLARLEFLQFALRLLHRVRLDGLALHPLVVERLCGAQTLLGISHEKLANEILQQRTERVSTVEYSIPMYPGNFGFLETFAFSLMSSQNFSSNV